MSDFIQYFYNITISGFTPVRIQISLQISDDFFGKVRFREQGSTGGNNGLKSLIAHLGTEKFPRLRISTANDTLRNKNSDFDFVLSKITSEEYKKTPPNP